MSTPITHRIADKAPEFPCWLWHRGNHLTNPGWYDSRTMIQSWLPAPDHTHWCHNTKRPTHAPESQAQGPSDSEMLTSSRAAGSSEPFPMPTPKKKQKQKLDVERYLAAGEYISRMPGSNSDFTCNLINLIDGDEDVNTAEAKFHADVHDITGGVPFDYRVDAYDPDALFPWYSPYADPVKRERTRRELRELRLMALALSYTLACEVNKGRCVL